MAKSYGRTATVVAIDGGGTTGIAVITIDKQWLRGLGDPTWDGLGRAIRGRAVYQIGNEPKMFDVDTGRSTRLDGDDLNERLMPILARQPLVKQDGMRSMERFEAILDGSHPAGGDDLSYERAQEIIQLRQIAGLLDNYAEAAIVIESFLLRTEIRNSEVISPDRLRLAIEAEEVLHGEGRVPFLQTPSEMKSDVMPLKKGSKTVRDYSRLQRAGLYFPGMEHGTDAAGHAAKFFKRARTHEEIRSAAWPLHFREWPDDEPESLVLIGTDPDVVFDSGFEVQ
jgi:hypothetical protein